jgi:hypothetical protein
MSACCPARRQRSSTGSCSASSSPCERTLITAPLAVSKRRSQPAWDSIRYSPIVQASMVITAICHVHGYAALTVRVVLGAGIARVCTMHCRYGAGHATSGGDGESVPWDRIRILSGELPFRQREDSYTKSEGGRRLPSASGT